MLTRRRKQACEGEVAVINLGIASEVSAPVQTVPAIPSYRLRVNRQTKIPETREQRLTFPFPFVHLQSHVYQQPRPSGTTINRGNENSNLAAV